MSNWKLGLAAVGVALLLVIMLNLSFNSIQEQDYSLDLEMLTEESVFTEALDFLDAYYTQEIYDGFRLSDEHVYVVDHHTGKILAYDGNAYETDYETFPEEIKYGNVAFALINGKRSCIINKNQFGKNFGETLVCESYKKYRMPLNDLNPQEIIFYDSTKDLVDERYLRRKLLEVLIDGHNSGDLKPAKVLFEQWKEVYGEGYKNVLAYDRYEGEMAMVRFKIKQAMTDGYSLEDYIQESMATDIALIAEADRAGITFLPKEKEYALIGLMVAVLGGKETAGLQADVETLLLKVPLDYSETYMEDYSTYVKAHDSYLEQIRGVEEAISMDAPSYTMMDLTGESMGLIYQLDEHMYLSMTYEAMLKDGGYINGPVIFIIEPYKIEYFMR